MRCVYHKQRSNMGCNCKNNMVKRARVILHNRKWESLNDVEKGQIEGLYHKQHQTYGTEEEIINWLNKK